MEERELRELRLKAYQEARAKRMREFEVAVDIWLQDKGESYPSVVPVVPPTHEEIMEDARKIYKFLSGD